MQQLGTPPQQETFLARRVIGMGHESQGLMIADSIFVHETPIGSRVGISSPLHNQAEQLVVRRGQKLTLQHAARINQLAEG